MNIMDIIYIVLIVLFIVIFIIFIKYNKLIRTQNNVKKDKANIEICLNKRFDLIPNLVECVKSYSKYESDTLEEIVLLRNNYKEHENMNIQQAGMMNKRLDKCLAIVESYPDLKANLEYLNLQNELRNIENELSVARTKYNDTVTAYNTLIETVPSNIVASIFSFKKAELFQIEDERKENIKINF